MAGGKPKKKHSSKGFVVRMLRSMNSAKIAGSELMQFAEEVHRLKPEDLDFEGRTITAIKLFGGSDRAMSACFRMEALAKIISEGRLPGWTKPGESGSTMTHTALFEAAGQVPLRLVNERFEFSRSALLKKAFQLAKLCRE